MINEWKDRWALVTGASAGIGVALAEELAAGGTHLLLTARRLDRLEKLAGELHKKHNVQTQVFAADLAKREAQQKIFDYTKERGLRIDLLINNAGFGQYGELQTVDRQRLIDMVEVNCTAVVHLTRLFLADMVPRRSGDILIVASTAAFQAVPYISTYAATKAFDLYFAEGLAEEMKPHGIRVCALCPGSTESEFHAVAGQEKFTTKKQESAEKVARTGLRALADGRSYVISGLGNYLGAHSQRIVSRRMVTRVAAHMFRPEKSRKN
jgi:short-subunit dehydrogenase